MKTECNGCVVMRTTLLRSLPDTQASRLSCVFRSAQYRRNQILFFEGGAAEHLFALRSGLVKMVKPIENGKQRIVHVLAPGEIFGLEALSESHYPLTAVVLQDSEICSISRDEFFTFLRANPDVSLEVVRLLAKEVADVRQEMTSLSFKDARMKLAIFLAALVPPGQVSSSKGYLLRIPLSSQEIGEVLELSSETVSRTWKRLERDGLLEKRGRQIAIPSLSALEKAAHG